MSENDKRYLDDFVKDLDVTGPDIDSRMKHRILDKTYKKLRYGWFSVRNIAAACLLVFAVSAMIPNTPVNALCQKIFSFIPGVGVVQSNKGSGEIKSVLKEPVKITDGDEFIEIKTAYVKDNTLNVSAKTNVGAIDAGEFKDAAELKKFFSGETSPEIYLLSGNERHKSIQTQRSGPSFETRVYSINAGFTLNNDDLNMQTFKLELEGFDKTVEIKMSPAESGTVPQDLGRVAVIDDVMVFADINRTGNALEILLSAVAPKEYNNIRFSLFDIEKELFQNGVYIVDEEGSVYEADDEMRKQNSSDMNSFYFNIPQNKKGLKLVVPQILYTKQYYNGDIKINMPKKGKDAVINRQIDLNESTVQIEKASFIPANDPLLPDDFKPFDCLKIDAGASRQNNSREVICRVIPDIQVKRSMQLSDWMSGYIRVSNSVNAELWSRNKQRGYSIVQFENMDKAGKILLNFDVECAMIGPWEIEIE
ncbi:MAG: hypothetical protein ABFD25_10695 [Clostridiaceae bacterium]